MNWIGKMGWAVLAGTLLVTAQVGAAEGAIVLPDRISVDQLNRMMREVPGTYTIIDIRAREQYSDYHAPGSLNVPLEELIANPNQLPGTGSIVFVDRDGSLAMVIAGIFAQRTERPVKALLGGLDAFWQKTGPQSLLGIGLAEEIQFDANGVQPSAPESSPAPSRPAPADRPAPERPSAGC
jgi:rhodanese-related sulfurtransferase